MRSRELLPRLTFANVCSALALFIALSGGVAWAAGELKKNSVRAKHIAPKQVRAKHIAPRTIKARHLSKQLTGKGGAAGIRGPQGPKGDAGPAGPKGMADGVLMGKGPLTKHSASLSPYPEIPLGSMKEFSVHATCASLEHPVVKVYVRSATGGTVIFGGTGPGGGANLSIPYTFGIFEVATQPGVAKRFSQYSATVIGADGEIFDVRGMVYVQRNDAPNPLFGAERACGFNQASFLKASR